MEKSKNIHEHYSFSTKYTIKSGIGDIDNYRYCTKINGKLFAKNDNEIENKKVCIGKFRAFNLLINDAEQSECSVLDVFDSYQEVMDIGSEIYDFQQNEFKYAVNNFYDDMIDSSDILILSRMEILPEFQGYGLSKNWMKQIILNFSPGCGLVVAKSFPLQLEGIDDEAGKIRLMSEWDKKMGYQEKDKNEAKVKESLMKYHKSMGFETIPKISKEIIFLNPSMRNRKMEKIKY